LNSSLKREQIEENEQEKKENNNNSNNKIIEYSNIQISNYLNSNELSIPSRTTLIPTSKSISLSSSSSLSKLNESSTTSTKKNLSSTPIGNYYILMFKHNKTKNKKREASAIFLFLFLSYNRRIIID
jgi:hypothetical protein